MINIIKCLLGRRPITLDHRFDLVEKALSEVMMDHHTANRYCKEHKLPPLKKLETVEDVRNFILVMHPETQYCCFSYNKTHRILNASENASIIQAVLNDQWVM